jgi:HEAT repeat protein
MLRLDVARALAELADAKARPALEERLHVELDPRVRRRLREALRDLGQEGKRVPELRSALDKLEAEHAELRGRISALEARLPHEETAKSPRLTKQKKPKKLAQKRGR